jgi:DNA-binding GntR family transcriptional regulator
MIVRGRLAPGSRVVESDVADRLGISRTPVRSALQRLQQEGYIVAAGGAKQVRLSVAPLTIEDSRELFEVVGAVEALAARGAAELEMEARDRLVAELVRINAELLHASRREQPDRNELFELDTAFHRCYVEAGAGARTLALHDAVKPQAERYIRLYINALADEIGRSVHEHAATLACIESGDPHGAQSAVQTNWRNASERFSHVISTLGERGSW